MRAFFLVENYTIYISSLYSVPLELSFSWNIFQIHFGVNSGATRFALENQAVNEATFRCPDELGWKPQVALLPNTLIMLIYSCI
jgi:pyroglutamyl-peptidase